MAFDRVIAEELGAGSKQAGTRALARHILSMLLGSKKEGQPHRKPDFRYLEPFLKYWKGLPVQQMKIDLSEPVTAVQFLFDKDDEPELAVIDMPAVEMRSLPEKCQMPESMKTEPTNGQNGQG